MEQEEIFLLATAATACSMIVAACSKKRNKKCNKRIWSKQWLQRREEGKGILTMLNEELLVEDLASYRNFLRMPNEYFEKLLSLIEEDIMKKDTCMRTCISSRNRLEVTLRFLATGETFRSLMYSSRIHESTISKFIINVCDAIYQHLKKDYMKFPSTQEEWQKIADDFNNMWQFPHCIGAIDGRHITFRPPRSDGSLYYNYKGDHSLVLLAAVDAKYRFVYSNVGCNGRVSDGGVLRGSRLYAAIENNQLNLPTARQLNPDSNIQVPYVFVADDAFPLCHSIMKPYPNRGLSHEERIFNYRLSRARRIVENAFGILANRFRVLLNPIHLRPSKVEVITLACVALHNFLATENEKHYIDPSEVLDCPQLHLTAHQAGNRTSNLARRYREEFKHYFNNNGAVAWQEEAIKNYNS